jgi:hypothetical protein
MACKTAKPTYKHLSQSRLEKNVTDQLLQSALVSCPINNWNK